MEETTFFSPIFFHFHEKSNRMLEPHCPPADERVCLTGQGGATWLPLTAWDARKASAGSPASRGGDSQREGGQGCC